MIGVTGSGKQLPPLDACSVWAELKQLQRPVSPLIAGHMSLITDKSRPVTMTTACLFLSEEGGWN